MPRRIWGARVNRLGERLQCRAEVTLAIVVQLGRLERRRRVSGKGSCVLSELWSELLQAELVGVEGTNRTRPAE